MSFGELLGSDASKSSDSEADNSALLDSRAEKTMHMLGVDSDDDDQDFRRQTVQQLDMSIDDDARDAHEKIEAPDQEMLFSSQDDRQLEQTSD